MTSSFQTDSFPSWLRLVLGTLTAIIGTNGIWAVIIVLPAVQQEFGVDRSVASLPYSMTMIGFAVGNVLAGKAVDRFGLALPMAVSSVLMSLGYFWASAAENIYLFTAIQGIFIGQGAAVFFGPFLADISHYFERYRGIAVAVAASSNYVAGALWPFFIEPFLSEGSWRDAYFWIGSICSLILLPMTLYLRQSRNLRESSEQAKTGYRHHIDSGFSPAQIQWMLMIAGVGCCVAMSMPQVHIVALCSDFGYSVAVGTEMLSLMLACGIVSRLGSGLLADRIGGVRTLLIGSCLQCVSLVLYVQADGLVSLYVVSAVFGLSQGGIVPSYTLIIREYLPAETAGLRVGALSMATISGMALGGWLSGEIYDWTGSYQVALLNGIAWNMMNIVLVGMLWVRSLRIKFQPD